MLIFFQTWVINGMTSETTIQTSCVEQTTKHNEVRQQIHHWLTRTYLELCGKFSTYNSKAGSQILIILFCSISLLEHRPSEWNVHICDNHSQVTTQGNEG